MRFASWDSRDVDGDTGKHEKENVQSSGENLTDGGKEDEGSRNKTRLDESNFPPMNLTNDSYLVLLRTKTGKTERYYRDETGWIKESTQGRKFRATAEQVLNHLLPVLAGIKSGMTAQVLHDEQPLGAESLPREFRGKRVSKKSPSGRRSESPRE